MNDDNFPHTIVEINNPESLILFHKIVIPSSLGDETQTPPFVGKYCNALMVYETNGHSYLYSSDGIPTPLGFASGGILVVEDFPELEQATPDSLYIKSDTGEAKLTHDNQSWVMVAGEAPEFNQILNRPKYAGVEMTNDTDIPDVSSLSSSLSAETDAREQADTALQLSKQNRLVPGTNIQIDANNTISATDTKYTAGDNITISANNEISAVGTHYEVGAEVKIGTWTESGTTYDVYRKVVDFGALPNAGDKDVSHGITNAVKFINLYAITDDGVNIRPIPFTSGTAATNQITLYASRTNVHIHAGTDRSDENAYVTIEYLKNQA